VLSSLRQMQQAVSLTSVAFFVLLLLQKDFYINFDDMYPHEFELIQGRIAGRIHLNKRLPDYFCGKTKK
jgi:hypothetical protein